jgi:hypothetical protein
MRVVVCYIAVCNGPKTQDFCARFVSSWHECPPGFECELIVICNGGPLPTDIALMFEGMNAKMWPRPNDEGFDISAYIEAANGPCKDADIMLCLGESVHFHWPGWLRRLVEAYKKHGPGLYGPFSSNTIRAHLQTTAFFCPPKLLREYPRMVKNRAARYEFEHGLNSLWRFVHSRGLAVRLVTWDGEWEPMIWRMPPNIHYRGDQSNCLMWCNHSDGFAAADPIRKRSWARFADAPFK